jgi:membrane protease YdiL (CAAX protease family)
VWGAAPREALTDAPAPRQGPEPPARWGLGDVAVGLVPLALSAAALVAGGDDGDDDITIAALLAASAFGWLFLVGVPVFATRLKGRGPVHDLGLRFRPVDLAAFPLGVVLQALIVPGLYWPILRLLDQTTDDVSAEARELTDAATGGGIALLVLVVCVGAPFAEELFYRGLLLRSVEKRWTLGAAVAAATVVFAVAHFQGIQLPALLLFGLVASLLAARTGRLGPSILCHAGFNAWTVFHLLVIDR